MLVEIIHTTCRQIAFYAREAPTPGATMQPGNFVLLDGRQPSLFDWIVCGSCGKRLQQTPSFNLRVGKLVTPTFLRELA